jgi:hypothetical protein
MGELIEKVMNKRQFVRCRTIGHSWDDIPADPSPDGFQMWLRCVSCGMVRKDTIGRHTGYLIGRRYEAPEGYSLAGEDVPTRDDFRLQLITLADTFKKRRDRAGERSKRIAENGGTGGAAAGAG